MKLNFDTLKTRQHELGETLPQDVYLRVHRALSWLKAANESSSPDAKFIFLWIAFNAAYAQEFKPGQELMKRDSFKEFLGRLLRLDNEDLIYNIVWKNYSGKIRLFIDNQYVSRYFWDYHNGRLTEEQWVKKFERSRAMAQKALAIKDTVVFVGILFDRLYVLRNQLVHGGATWESKVNRDQVRDGYRIMQDLVPAIIHIIMENAEEAWGKPCYPPV
ncbi:MAG: HEPN domain-containing protein [Kiritimatiellae bacterium]|nr:HEPN domain-containing protein [Kiritimatiellia bacterium]